MNKCKHLKVKQVFLKSGERYGDYICPDCDAPISCFQASALERQQGIIKPSFKIARYSMAGVGDYWKKLQADGSFKSNNQLNPALMLEV